jgi:hypothetical protein
VAAGRRYSAGRIFLQVVPSFRNVQRDTRREVEKLNKAMSGQMDKASEAAGRRAGETAGSNYVMGFEKAAVRDQKAVQRAWQKGLLDLDKMNRASYERSKRAAEKVWQDARKRAAREREAAIRAERKAAARAEQIAIQQAQREERQEVARLKKLGRLQAAAHAEDLRRSSRANALAAKERQKAYAAEEKALRESMARRGGAARIEIEKAIKGIERSIGDVDLSTPIGRELDKIVRKSKQTSAEIGAGLIPVEQGRRQIEALGRDFDRVLRRLPRGDISQRGNVKAAIRDIRDMTKALDGANSRGGFMSRWLRGTAGDANDGANAFRIFNYRVLGAVTLLPLLVPLLAATAGGLVGLTTAALGAGAGLGVMLLAFSGIGDAVKALGDVQDNAAKDSLAASKTMRNAARGVRDAQQGLAQARLSAARSAEDSNRRIADAEERLADAQRDATEAQEDLREARRAAQADQDALADRIASGALDERQALIDLFNAQVAYNSAMADGGATNLEREQASIDLERARLAIKGIRRDNKELAAEQQRYAKEGINANEGVQAATQKVADSQRAVRDAERDVAEARRDAAEAAVDAQRQIRDAQERLTDAQMSYQEALTQTGDIGSGSMQKLEQAMGKLSPAGRAFALYLFSLREGFYELRALAQEGLLPGLQEGMETVIGRYGPGFARFVSTMAKGMGDFFREAAVVLTSPVWENFFAMMERNSPKFGADFGTTFLNVMTGIVALMTAFEPIALAMSDAFVRLSGDFAEWAAGLGESEGFQSFLAYLEKTGPKVWRLLEAIVGAFVNLGIALAPIADKLLDFAISFFEWIANMDPDQLAAIATLVLGFVLASQLAAGATQLLITAMTPFHSVVGAVVFALVALGAGLLYAYQHSETFREVVDKVFGFVRDHWQIFATLAGVVLTLGVAFVAAFRILSIFYGPLGALFKIFGFLRFALLGITGPIGLIILGIGLLIAAFVWLWQNVEGFRNFWKAAWDGIVTVVTWVWTHVLQPYFNLMFGIFRTLWEIVSWVFSLINPVIELFAAIIRALWSNTVGPALGWIGGKFQWLGEKLGAIWSGWIEPFLDKFGLGADDLKRIWSGALDAIGRAWHNLQDLVKKPVRYIVETVINKGFVANFNKLAAFFGTTPIKPLSLSWLNNAAAEPRRSAGGGRNTRGGSWHTGGYTGPGAKFQPAGVVHADEYVIRKEATNRIRAKYGLQALDYMNMHGEMPGFAGGGLVSPIYKKLTAWVKQNLPGKVITSGYRPGAITALGNRSLHGMGMAVDIGPPDMAAFREIKAAFGKAITQLFYSPAGGAQVLNGRNWYSDPVTRRGHWDHIHWGMRSFRGGGALGDGGGFFDWFASPINFLKKTVNSLTDDLGDHPFAKFLTRVPLKLVDMATDKISDMLDFGGSEDQGRAPRDNAGQFYTGGLVHNGAMMYDSGGYLPPGITTVINATGRPEPVFSADQWDDMQVGGRSALIGNLDLDVNGTDLTPADVIGELLYQVERVNHGGKYAGLGN